MSTPAAYVPPVDRPPADVPAPYGGFWIRFVAYSVDGMLIWLLSTVISVIWLVVAGVTKAEDPGMAMMYVVIIAATQLYHAYFVSSEKMATPGKRWCGLYVTDLEGRRLSFGRALWRNIAALFSYLTLYIGFFMAGFTEKKQALHDKIAGTLVHRQPNQGAGALVLVIVITSFIGIAMIGILAAIAIPAYQDFVNRSKVAGVLQAMTVAEEPIAEYYTKNGQWPGSWEQAGAVDPMLGVGAESGAVVEEIHLDASSGAIVARLKLGKGGSLFLVPRADGGVVTWSCAADEAIHRYVPGTCRQ